jgi:hypothetical protein
MFKNAADDNMRVVALAQVATAFRGTNAKTIAKFLAEIVLSESYSRDVRLVAYLVLFEVCNLPLYNLPLVHDFKIPEDLDWNFLYECVR